MGSWSNYSISIIVVLGISLELFIPAIVSWFASKTITNCWILRCWASLLSNALPINVISPLFCTMLQHMEIPKILHCWSRSRKGHYNMRIDSVCLKKTVNSYPVAIIMFFSLSYRIGELYNVCPCHRLHAANPFRLNFFFLYYFWHAMRGLEASFKFQYFRI